MSDRYYRYRCLVCNAPFDYVNDPEQACPDCEGVGGIPEPPFTTSDMHPYGGLVVCFTCGGSGKIAANVNTTDAQAKLNVNEAAKTRQDDANGPIPASTLPRHDDTPAPVDQPDELEQQTARLHELESKVDATELGQILEAVRMGGYYDGGMERAIGDGLDTDVAADRINAYIARRVLEELEALSMDVVEPCEPDCDAVRHALHQGTWNAHLRIDQRIAVIKKEAGE